MNRLGRAAQGAIPVILAALALAVGGCLGEPISKKVGPGGTITLTLAGIRSGVVFGYGSTLFGTDVQRGQLRFVLCPMSSSPLCATGAAAVPRGFALESLFVTRSATDSASPAGLDGAHRTTTAVIQIPASDDLKPAPGTYRLEPRIVTPQGIESLAVEDGFVRTLGRRLWRSPDLTHLCSREVDQEVDRSGSLLERVYPFIWIPR